MPEHGYTSSSRDGRIQALLQGHRHVLHCAVLALVKSWWPEKDIAWLNGINPAVIPDQFIGMQGEVQGTAESIVADLQF